MGSSFGNADDENEDDDDDDEADGGCLYFSPREYLSNLTSMMTIKKEDGDDERTGCFTFAHLAIYGRHVIIVVLLQ